MPKPLKTMATFIVRVQLSIESYRRYTWLRDNLTNRGFTKRVSTKEGIEYRLPNGNYLVESESDCLTITQKVLKIAKQIDENPMVLTVEVVKENGIPWVNLEQF